MAALLSEAIDKYDQANQALREGDLARYEELRDEGDALVEQARDLVQGSVGDEEPTTTTTTTEATSA